MKASLICDDKTHPLCNCPYARIEEGKLIITSYHHGESHTNYINIASLIQFARDDALPFEANSVIVKEGE